jgi:predicted nuclease of predicted toxin-antitoxin system
MRIKVDEDIPVVVAAWLQEGGHLASTVAEQGMGGRNDRALREAVQAERRFLITADKGFGDIRRYPPGTHAGALLLRPDQDGIRPILELL